MLGLLECMEATTDDDLELIYNYNINKVYQFLKTTAQMNQEEAKSQYSAAFNSAP